MYTAKRDGGACHRVYVDSMHDAAIARLDLTADLDRTLEEGGLDVAYQPVVVLGTGAVTGFEALARWQHPVLGAISPAEFIPPGRGDRPDRPVGTLRAVPGVRRPRRVAARARPRRRARGECEPVAPAARRPAPARPRGRGPEDHPGPRRPAVPGGDRERARWFGRRGEPGPPEDPGPGGAALARRLRHRPLVPVAARRLSLRRGEDRSQLRVPARRRGPGPRGRGGGPAAGRGL
ncbi:EAL domain-containing protein [Nocardioides panacis]|uniref:EAL domain-containing protein n=1 Tax=Nocardioides panacis TaxID=2849501 RepID=A0A975T3I2_9ACTN|nr:EAL domain-containing protein [Nocardioides panacis]